MDEMRPVEIACSQRYSIDIISLTQINAACTVGYLTKRFLLMFERWSQTFSGFSVELEASKVLDL